MRKIVKKPLFMEQTFKESKDKKNTAVHNSADKVSTALAIFLLNLVMQ